MELLLIYLKNIQYLGQMLNLFSKEYQVLEHCKIESVPQKKSMHLSFIIYFPGVRKSFFKYPPYMYPPYTCICAHVHTCRHTHTHTHNPPHTHTPLFTARIRRNHFLEKSYLSKKQPCPLRLLLLLWMPMWNVVCLCRWNHLIPHGSRVSVTICAPGRMCWKQDIPTGFCFPL